MISIKGFVGPLILDIVTGMYLYSTCTSEYQYDERMVLLFQIEPTLIRKKMHLRGV